MKLLFTLSTILVFFFLSFSGTGLTENEKIYSTFQSDTSEKVMKKKKEDDLKNKKHSPGAKTGRMHYNTPNENTKQDVEPTHINNTIVSPK